MRSDETMLFKESKELQLCVLIDQFYALPFLPSMVGNSLTLGILRTTVSKFWVPLVGMRRRGEKRERVNLREEREQSNNSKKERVGIGTMWRFEFTQHFHIHYLSFPAIQEKGIIVPIF